MARGWETWNPIDALSKKLFGKALINKPRKKRDISRQTADKKKDGKL